MLSRPLRSRSPCRGSVFTRNLRPQGGGDRSKWPKVPPEVVAEGHVISHVAKALAKDILSQNPGVTSSSPRRLRVGSCCSGSGMDYYMLKDLEVELTNVLGKEIVFDIAWMIEIDKTKLDILFHSIDGDTCFFADVTVVCKEASWCKKHMRMCVIKEVDFVLSGFSCKALSTQNNAQKKKGSVLARGDADASTFQTFEATALIVKLAKPTWVILENLDNITAAGDTVEEGGKIVELASNADVVINRFEAEGYHMRIYQFHTHDYALPQRRPRAVFLGISGHSKLALISSYDSYFERFGARMRRLRHEPPSFLQCLFDDSNDHIQQELTRKTLSLRSRSNPVDENWPAMHMEQFKKIGLRWGTSKPNAGMMESEWWNLFSPREQDCIVYTHHKRKAQLAVMKLGFDVSQSLTRTAISGETPLGTQICCAVIPHGKIVVDKRYMLGREMMTVQGFPWQKIKPSVRQTMPESLMADLAGNMYPGTVFALAVGAAIFGVDGFTTPSSECSMKVAADALKLAREMRRAR